MRLNLSSQIVLDQVEERLYRPGNAYEKTMLTAYEKVNTNIYPSDEEVASVVAQSIADDINECAKSNRPFTLVVSGGESPDPVLKALVMLHKEGKVSFRNVHVFPMYEFYPLRNSNDGVLGHLREELLDRVDIPEANIHAFDVDVPKNEIERSWEAYYDSLQKLGGIDTIILGVGRRASVGLNAPGSVAVRGLRLTALDATSIAESVKHFNTKENVPRTAVNLGIGEVLRAKKIILLAFGEAKAEIIKTVVEGPESNFVPASLLRSHDRIKLYIDLHAAEELTRIKHPWKVTSLDWTPKLIRRAIVWLCHEVGKPILNLTNQDYSDHQLGELLTKYGSAYEVNIKVFNDIQHTITGWPGGKPNADDSQRPERALPEKKRVLIFSPHPDDDVISMGGTFHRLVEQGHDVHVAYETSGNIAVGDEEVIRYLAFLRNVLEHEGAEGSELYKKANVLRDYLLYEKEEGALETPETRFLKGTIRREEARTADRFIGVKKDHIHFLDLPFYETGAIKKGPLTEKDVERVIELLRAVKPHQIFVAGDLADPHGTHRVALNAALAALDVLKDEKWMKDCRIWMYRGAWAEWDIEDIEMAVPMSPEQLRFKRNSILKHQSQMEAAPFLGDDERLFWQRSEDRNRATAELYRKLGLASYEAIEAFVRYHPIP